MGIDKETKQMDNESQEFDNLDEWRLERMVIIVSETFREGGRSNKRQDSKL